MPFSHEPLALQGMLIKKATTYAGLSLTMFQPELCCLTSSRITHSFQIVSKPISQSILTGKRDSHPVTSTVTKLLNIQMQKSAGHHKC